jgi:hypothetical protein
VPERWRSNAARQLAQAVRDAGGTIERKGTGKLVVTGPAGSVTVNEPSGETRRDLRRSAAGKLAEERTGLAMGGGG